jgi:hypothetical protein
LHTKKQDRKNSLSIKFYVATKIEASMYTMFFLVSVGSLLDHCQTKKAGWVNVGAKRENNKTL